MVIREGERVKKSEKEIEEETKQVNKKPSSLGILFFKPVWRIVKCVTIFISEYNLPCGSHVLFAVFFFFNFQLSVF